MGSIVIPAGDVGALVRGDVNHFLFNTVDSTGLPTTIAGATVQKRNLSTGAADQTGVDISTDYGGVTGSNRVEVDTTGYAKNVDYAIELTAGTVGAVPVAGMVVGQFSVAGKSSGRLYDQVVKVYQGSVTAVDGTQPTRIFTANVPGISNTANMLLGQVCTFQPRVDGSASQNQGVGRAVLKSSSAGTDLVTITVQDGYPNPIALGDEFCILPEERELTIYTSNITVEWGFGQDAPANVDAYSVQWSADGNVIDPSSIATFTNMRLQSIRRSDDVQIVDVSWPGGSLNYGNNAMLFKWEESTNRIAPNDGATMLATATIDGIDYVFGRTLHNYV